MSCLPERDPGDVPDGVGATRRSADARWFEVHDALRLQQHLSRLSRRRELDNLENDRLEIDRETGQPGERQIRNG